MNASEIPTLEQWFSQSLFLLQQGKTRLARQELANLVQTYPDCKEAWYQLGEIAQQLGELTLAIEYYCKVLELDASIQEVYNNLGVIATRQGQRELASGYFFKALEINPNFAPGHINLGHLFLSLAQSELAVHHFSQALQAESALAAPLFQQSLLLVQQGLWAEAKILLAAVAKLNQPIAVSALLKLAFCLQRDGANSEALACLAQAQERDADGAVALMDALYTPVVYSSEADLAQWRQRVHDKLSALESQAESLSFSRLQEIDWYPFYWAYQGHNDRPLMARLVNLLKPTLEALSLPESAPLPQRLPDAPLRIGWVSRYFHNHSVARCFLPVLQNFPAKTTHLLFQVPGSQSEILEGPFRERVSALVPLMPSLAQAQEQIRQQGLDVLIYADLGLDPFSWLLAAQRLAGLQYLLPGHPTTSGLSSMDGFISSSQLELPTASAHYSEPLVLLDHPLVNFPLPPVSEPLSREAAGLPEGHLYFCPVTLFKLHPSFDAALAGILGQDSQAQIICFQDQSEGITGLLKQRWQAALAPNYERMHVIPWVSAARFQQLLALADVVLDPFPFGFGTTAYLALAAEVPIISWPSEFLPGRSVQALYGQLGLEHGLADSLQDYIAQAVAFANDSTLSEAWRAQMQAGKGLLFNNSLGGQELAVFLQDAVARQRKAVSL
jgi:protein O-GlcNAc transferase